MTLMPALPALLMALICPLAALESAGMDPAFAKTIDQLIEGTVQQITVPELAAKPGRYLLLDARSEQEFQVAHLPRAIRVGFRDFDPDSVAGLPKDQPVVVYCSVGYRSEKIGERLREAGFLEVHNLYGGIFEWFNQGHRVVDSDGHRARTVHPYNRRWGRWLRSPDQTRSR